MFSYFVVAEQRQSRRNLKDGSEKRGVEITDHNVLYIPTTPLNTSATAQILPKIGVYAGGRRIHTLHYKPLQLKPFTTSEYKVNYRLAITLIYNLQSNCGC